MSTVTHNTNRQSSAYPRFRSPFDLADDGTYQRWRDAKLSGYPENAAELIVEIADLANPTEAERAAIAKLCRKANMAIYVSRQEYQDPERLRHDLLAFAGAFELRRIEGHRSATDDGIVAIEMARDKHRKGYIPYSNRPLSWHTDGYYNAPEDRIRSFILHCCRNAEQGGENGLLDPEIGYIRLRDENPKLITALMHEGAMTIPANHEDNGNVRPESIGPVYIVDRGSGALQMRYTARGRHIVWRDDSGTREAVAFIAKLLAGEEPRIFWHTLKPGQGIICNNVLHSRTGFEGGSSPSVTSDRLLCRIRYLDPIAKTGPMDQHTEGD